jgi:hypothetical protein
LSIPSTVNVAASGAAAVSVAGTVAAGALGCASRTGVALLSATGAGGFGATPPQAERRTNNKTRRGLNLFISRFQKNDLSRTLVFPKVIRNLQAFAAQISFFTGKLNL